MSKRAISVSDKFDSFHLSFNLDELKESLETNQKESPAASVFSNGKRLWLGDGKPEVIQNIDLQIRKRFSIPVGKSTQSLSLLSSRKIRGQIFRKIFRTKRVKF